jgi:hypothetical protein
MKPMMNDDRFFDLAVKAIAGQATEVERAELDGLLAREPELRTEFARLQADARVAKDVLPLLDATQATTGELPAYAHGRLQTKVRQTFGQPTAPSNAGHEKGMMWKWRWFLGLATVTAAIVLLLGPGLTPPGHPVIQVAMLDTVGAVRGSDTSETEILKQRWQTARIQTFDKPDLLENWETNWPQDDKVAAKVIYDRAAGEVRVLMNVGGKPQQTTFTVEQDLATTLQEANAFILKQIGK